MLSDHQTMHCPSSSKRNICVGEGFVGFQHYLMRWSQFEEAANRARTQDTSPATSLSNVTSNLLDDLELSCVQDSRTESPCEKLQLLHLPSTSRRYSKLTSKVATEIFLSSRNAYEVLRSFLILPKPSTLRSR